MILIDSGSKTLYRLKFRARKAVRDWMSDVYNDMFSELYTHRMSWDWQKQNIKGWQAQYEQCIKDTEGLEQPYFFFSLTFPHDGSAHTTMLHESEFEEIVTTDKIIVQDGEHQYTFVDPAKAIEMLERRVDKVRMGFVLASAFRATPEATHIHIAADEIEQTLGAIKKIKEKYDV